MCFILDIESRSLNLTAVPNLNLQNLKDYSLSKAHHLENSTKTTLSDVASIPAIKILNSDFNSGNNLQSKNLMMNKINVAKKRPLPSEFEEREERLEARDIGKLITKTTSPPSLDRKIYNTINRSDILNKDETQQQCEQESNKKQSTKLLALFEMSPDQYNELRLSISEQSSNINNLISTFLSDDNDDDNNENQQIQNGKF